MPKFRKRRLKAVLTMDAPLRDQAPVVSRVPILSGGSAPHIRLHLHAFACRPIHGAVAELERSLIAERVRMGIQNARKKGTRLGRPPLRELTVELLTQVKRDRRRGRMSFKQLAQKYGVSVWTAFQICRNAKGLANQNLLMRRATGQNRCF